MKRAEIMERMKNHANKLDKGIISDFQQFLTTWEQV